MPARTSGRGDRQPAARDEAVALDEFRSHRQPVRPAPRCTCARQGPGGDGRASHDVRLDRFRPGTCRGGRHGGHEIQGCRRDHPRQDRDVRLRRGLVLVVIADRPHQEPLRPERESGGSSAGTAVGVAANFGLVGIGEDTGGSIRIPAAYNNLFGLRVTTGLISRAGLSPLVHFQDTPAPVARTVADLATPSTASSATTRRTRSRSPHDGHGLGGYAEAVALESRSTAGGSVSSRPASATTATPTRRP